MKKKVKKISLNRETLRTLDGSNLRGVAGAATENPTRCDPNSNCVSCETCRLGCGGTETARTCPP
jgi:hypothetical protein